MNIIWKMIAVGHDNQECTFDLMAVCNDTLQLKETDNIQFQVTIEDEGGPNFGPPQIIISDIPIEMQVYSVSETKKSFISSEPLHQQSSRYFYNFFGESELCLVFDNTVDCIITKKINILARNDNAKIANEILGYINDNFEDAVSVCFSRSKILGDYNKDNSFNFSRLDIIERAIKYLTEHLPVFMREHKYFWQNEMNFSVRGQPTGPDSVHWVLSNLDKLTQACTEDVNIIFNGRGYQLSLLPKENIISNTDIFENRVIHTFLHNTSIFLTDLKDSFKSYMTEQSDISNNEYVRFDHTMQRYIQLALRQKSQHLESLIISTENIRRFLSKWLPAKVVIGLQPRMTPFVAKHHHYRHAFKFIEQCNTSPAPKFEGKNVLLGLKNLAIIYEISALLMLNEIIMDVFQVGLPEQNYVTYSSGGKLGGQISERPYGSVNNNFKYKNSIYDIELLYEPKIYPYNEFSVSGDLVDTSDTRATHRYGAHHFCPDFTIKIASKKWRKPITIILDAKYKDANAVKKYDIVPLTQQYLMNIHQVNERGSLDISPIQLLLILFAHDKNGYNVRTVAQRHTLTGILPVLPQAIGVLLKPSNKGYVEQQLNALIDIINRDNSL